MSSTRRSFIMLQERDIRIFDYFLKYRVASIYQMLEHLGIGCKRSNFLERLNKLIKHGYLTSNWYERKKVYSLGENGQKYMFENGIIDKEFELQHLGNVPAKTHHDMMLNDVYHLLEKLDGVRVVKTHNQFLMEMKSGFGRENVPDGSFKVNNEDGEEVSVAIEVELTPKRISKFRTTLYRYLRNRDINFVLYLVGSDYLRRKLLKELKDWERFQEYEKIFVAPLEEFLFYPEKCEFVSISKTPVTISTLPTIPTKSTIHHLWTHTPTSSLPSN